MHERLEAVVAVGSLGQLAAGERLAVRARGRPPRGPVRVDAERVEVRVHRIDRLRQRGVRLGELGAHVPPLGDVGDDAAGLDRAVRAAPAAGAVVHPARDPVGADQAVLDVRVLARRERGVVGVVHGPVLGVDGRFPVLHLGVRDGAAEQPIGARALEELLEAPVREGEHDVDVLADHVEQAGEALARLGEPRGRLVARGDVGDDAGHPHGAVGAAAGPGAIPQEPRDAVEPEQPVGDLGVLADEQALVEALVLGLVVRVDARLPEPLPAAPPAPARRGSGRASARIDGSRSDRPG